MDWIDHVEDLTGGELEDNPTPLLADFEEDGVLLQRVEKDLKRNDPTIETIDHVRSVLSGASIRLRKLFKVHGARQEVLGWSRNKN
jgi:hypothetical protein